MHGLINRAVQCFVRDVYGPDCWAGLAAEMGRSIGERGGWGGWEVTREAASETASETGIAGFEAMLVYDDAVTEEMIARLAARRGRPAADILEDIGTYLVTHETTRAIRRLLRFGGETFTEFLHSLDDLPERARLAVPELELPRLRLTELGPGRYRLRVCGRHRGFGAVLAGILRALADDYGALALLERAEGPGRAEVLLIELLDADFAEGRSFSLGGGPCGPEPPGRGWEAAG